MDPSFFGLSEDPFKQAAEPDGAALLDVHDSLVTELRAGLRAPHGITLVIGDSGADKSALMSAFAAQLSGACAVALLPGSGPGLRHLLSETIDQLGRPAPATDDEGALLAALREAARVGTERGRSTVVIVDDAHDLPAKTIERLGRLFGDDAAEPSGLHVILVGRPELLDRMNAANDRSILKHLVQVCRMDAIGAEDALRYISDRLERFGGVMDRVFTNDAARLIVNKAGGNRQRIDELCSAAMNQAGMGAGLPLGPDVVDLACGNQHGPAPGSMPGVQSTTGQSVLNGDDSESGSAARSGSGKRSGRRKRGRRHHGRRAQAEAEQSHSHESYESALTEESHNPYNSSGLHETTDTGSYSFDEEQDRLNVEHQPEAGRKRNRNRPRRAQKRSPAGGLLSRVTGSRRSLAISAVSLVAVLGLFAASMTDTRPGAAPEIEVAAKTPPRAPVERQRPGSKRPAGTTAAATDRQALPQRSVPINTGRPAGPELSTRPTATPKLVVQRGSASTAGTAAGAPAATAAAGQDGGSRGATAPVHASGRSRVSASSTKPSAPKAEATLPGGARTGVENNSPPARVASAAPLQQASPAAAAVPAVAAATPAATSGVGSTSGSATASQPAPRVTPPPVVSIPTPPDFPTAAAERGVAAVNPAPVTPTARAVIVEKAGYGVQIGAFRSRENAQKQLSQLSLRYPDGRIVNASTGDTTVYRVMSGSFTTKAEAEQRAVELGRSGFSTYVRKVP